MAVLVTGGSEGIGLELAKCFARDGHELVLVARDAAKLEAACAEFEGRAQWIAQDLSLPDGAQRLYAEVAARGIAVDVLVNNAGFGSLGAFSESALERDRAMMRLNVDALVTLTRLFLPPMLERKRGAIFNVGSTAGFQPGPLMAVYYATKAFVLSFSEALANELKGTGVQVSVLCPGPVRTAFQRKAGIAATVPMHGGVMNAGEVARVGYEAFKRGEITVIPGLRNRMLALLVRVAPRRLVPAIVRRLQEARRG